MPPKFDPSINSFRKYPIPVAGNSILRILTDDEYSIWVEYYSLASISSDDHQKIADLYPIFMKLLVKYVGMNTILYPVANLARYINPEILNRTNEQLMEVLSPIMGFINQLFSTEYDNSLIENILFALKNNNLVFITYLQRKIKISPDRFLKSENLNRIEEMKPFIEFIIPIDESVFMNVEKSAEVVERIFADEGDPDFGVPQDDSNVGVPESEPSPDGDTKGPNLAPP